MKAAELNETLGHTVVGSIPAWLYYLCDVVELEPSLSLSFVTGDTGQCLCG